jgi:hypothetical protein
MSNGSQYSVPPGASIPYAFTLQQATDFLSENSGINLQTLPAWGTVINTATGDILVWVDASTKIHVIDISGMPLVSTINQAAYVSPDSSLVASLIDQLSSLSTGATIAIGALPFIIAVIVAIEVFKKRA